MLREESFLRNIGDQLGQVVTIDTSESYITKLFGPRIRLLVRTLHNLPHTIILPRIDREGSVEYKLEYSGLPNQCGRCRSREHQVRHCPKKENKTQQRTNIPAPAPKQVWRARPNVTQNRTENSISTSKAQEVNQPASPLPPSPPPQLHETEPPVQREDETSVPLDSTLHRNDINFPQLSSPTPQSPPQRPTPTTPTETPEQTPTFVWRPKAVADSPKTKGKEKVQSQESTPITRQGYRTGRLAEDFWSAIGMPQTPPSFRKKLKVVPLLTRNEEQTEYLVNKSPTLPLSITEAHVAEVLAGIPWSTIRAQKHVVSETAQALNKVLIFNNTLTSPFQTWSQGKWFANWDISREGEHTCTMYVCIAVPEVKLKIRKGRDFGWRRIPDNIREVLANSPPEQIHVATPHNVQWQAMAGSKITTSPTMPQQLPTSPNHFAVLSEEESLSS